MSEQTLSDIEEIKKLKARYCRFVDTRNWEGLRALFTDAARSTLGGDDQSADEFVSLAREWLADSTSVHSVSMPEIEITGTHTARGIWGMEDMVTFPCRPGEAPKGIHGWGHYKEEYRKVNDHWLIHRMDLQRLRLDPLEGASPTTDDWTPRGTAVGTARPRDLRGGLGHLPGFHGGLARGPGAGGRGPAGVAFPSCSPRGRRTVRCPGRCTAAAPRRLRLSLVRFGWSPRPAIAEHVDARSCTVRPCGSLAYPIPTGCSVRDAARSRTPDPASGTAGATVGGDRVPVAPTCGR
ncbi:nuclear transport factor 2 family protein [Streptomyces sp. NPDC052492]|uniref:nuclear transport factor 2 family protein n=1 Tax=Streptomyces sp. NPDC052492 TaxID=3365691 RepID=UPI0037D4E1F0